MFNPTALINILVLSLTGVGVRPDGNCTNVGAIVDPVDGVEFWARGDAPSRFIAPTAETQGIKSGGRCSEGCYDHHGYCSALTKEWTRFAFRWSDLTQQGYGKQVPFSKRVLFYGFFQVERRPFELWVEGLTHFTGEPT